MKKILLLLLALLLLPLLTCTAEESVIINKITDPENTFTFPEDAKLLEIYFPKIYDCDAAFIRYGDYTMLLDCAGEQWERTQELLKRLDITELTYAYNSHPHTDHVHGFQYLLKDIKIENFLLSFEEDYVYANGTAKVVYDAMHANNVPFTFVHDGDTIDFGDVKMTVYQRSEEDLTGNNASALLKVEFGERSFLFTADIQMDAQLLFVNDNAPLQADFMKYPHHGYNNMQYAFLNLVDPELVIVTGASFSVNGLDVLKNNDVPYHYTELGILHLVTDGNVWVLDRIK